MSFTYFIEYFIILAIERIFDLKQLCEWAITNLPLIGFFFNLKRKKYKEYIKKTIYFFIFSTKNYHVDSRLFGCICVSLELQNGLLVTIDIYSIQHFREQLLVIFNIGQATIMCSQFTSASLFSDNPYFNLELLFLCLYLKLDM